MDQDSETEPEPVTVAIHELRTALEQSARDEGELAGDLEEIESQRREGHSLRQVMTQGKGGFALLRLGSILAHLNEAGGRFRRALASGLLREGDNLSGVARLLGVSRQRIYHLLQRQQSPTVDRSDS